MSKPTSFALAVAVMVASSMLFVGLAHGLHHSPPMLRLGGVTIWQLGGFPQITPDKVFPARFASQEEGIEVEYDLARTQPAVPLKGCSKPLLKRLTDAGLTKEQIKNVSDDSGERFQGETNTADGGRVRAAAACNGYFSAVVVWREKKAKPELDQAWQWTAGSINFIPDPDHHL
jgi:hypothetical protein